MKKKILIVSSVYYNKISENLISGATNFLKENNYEYEILNAPGCFEIPFIIKHKIDEYLGFIALGCVIRGETYHFELISNECTRKIMDISINFSKPIGFGILTCENQAQAIIRSDPNKKNKGKEAANACVSLINFIN